MAIRTTIKDGNASLRKVQSPELLQNKTRWSIIPTAKTPMIRMAPSSQTGTPFDDDVVGYASNARPYAGGSSNAGVIGCSYMWSAFRGRGTAEVASAFAAGC